MLAAPGLTIERTREVLDKLGALTVARDRVALTGEDAWNLFVAGKELERHGIAFGHN